MKRTLDITRRDFMKTTAALAGAVALGGPYQLNAQSDRANRPNILYVMTDQQRFDTIAALGNDLIYTPNLDRLVRRGVSFTRAYSSCPVCVPARWTIRTGCEPPTTASYSNGGARPVEGQPEKMEDRCGPFLGQAMSALGYRTFGIGKFHAFCDVGYETYLESDEMYGSDEGRASDAYASWLDKHHPEFAWVEQLMGERTDMYYMPQLRAMPANLAQEAWAADRAVEQIGKSDSRPYFGFVSFFGPHPPIAPPIPFNRMYDPDRMPSPVRGDLSIDHMDEQIPWMNHGVYAEDINDSHARVVRARYYGTVTYIDQCLGRILDAVEAGPDPDNTLICFFADHGDHLGDHSAWQKESFFEASCHVPFLVSWPKRLPKDVRRDELAALADLFGIATSAAGKPDFRQGADVLGLLDGSAKPRERVIGYYGQPGTPVFKIMVREGDWKYIFMANGGRQQLFNVTEDPHELKQLIEAKPEVAKRLREVAISALGVPNADRALDNSKLRVFPFQARPLSRIVQMEPRHGLRGFPEHPKDILP